MAAINDKTRSVFSEADKTILSNFTDQEIKQIDEAAKDLRIIIEAAKEREQAACNRRY